MIRNSSPTVATLRSLVARLHPGSPVRFFMLNPDETTSVMEMAATVFDQPHTTTANGIDKPDGEPSLAIWLREIRRTEKPEQPSGTVEITSLPGGKTLRMTEKPPPNSGDPS